MNLTYLKKVYYFVGPEVRKYFAWSIISGILWFGMESLFIIVLQVFLYAIGLIKIESMNLDFTPHFLLQSAPLAIAIFVVFGLVRALIMSTKEFTTGLALHSFIRFVRTKIINFGLRKAEEMNIHDIVTNFNEQVTKSGSYIKNLSHFFIAFTTFIFLLALGFVIAPKELSIGLVMLLIIFSPMRFLYAKVQEMGAFLTKSYSTINRSILLGLKNNFFLKLFNLLDLEVMRGEKSLREYEEKYKSHVILMSFKSSLPLFVGFLIVGLVSWMGLTYLGSSPGKLLSFFYIFLRIAQSLSDMNTCVSNLKLNQSTLKDLISWIESNEEQIIISEKAKTKVTMNEPLTEIALKNIAFGYSNDKILFQDLNIKLVRGDVLLIKGPSGAGKSTLLKVILGLNDALSGSVLFNKQDFTGKKLNLQNKLAYVGPEPFLIPGSVRDNLTYGLLDLQKVNESALVKSLESAHVKEEIFNLKGNLNFVLTEFASLSTGQKQRLALARAFLREPEILILDEATANLDSKTEHLILNVLKENKNKMITIVISHKDSFDALATHQIQLEARA